MTGTSPGEGQDYRARRFSVLEHRRAAVADLAGLGAVRARARPWRPADRCRRGVDAGVSGPRRAARGGGTRRDRSRRWPPGASWVSWAPSPVLPARPRCGAPPGPGWRRSPPKSSVVCSHSTPIWPPTSPGRRAPSPRDASRRAPRIAVRERRRRSAHQVGRHGGVAPPRRRRGPVRAGRPCRLRLPGRLRPAAGRGERIRFRAG